MECAVHIIEHLSGLNRCADDGTKRFIEALSSVAAPRVELADYDLTWMVKVSSATAVHFERRIHADAKRIACLAVRVLLEKQREPTFDRSWKHGTAHNDQVVVVLDGQRCSDLHAYPVEISEVKASIGVVRCSDANQTDVAF